MALGGEATASEGSQQRPYGAFSQTELEAVIQAKYPATKYLEAALAACAALRSSDEGEKSFLTRRGPAKQLCDEVLPIGYLCEYYLSSRWPGTEVQLILGSQTFDAIVSSVDRSVEIPSFIEVTVIEPEEHFRTRQVLASQGTAMELVRLDQLAEKFRRAITNKSEKLYPPGTLLLVFVRTGRRLDGWLDVALELAEELRDQLARFQRLIVMTERGLDLDFQP